METERLERKWMTEIKRWEGGFDIELETFI